MTLYTQTDMLYIGACFAYILSGVFCGIIRWLHMCKPYDANGEYFYPGRKQMTFFFAATVLQFPYLIHPMDTETWTYIRVFGILYYPLCFSFLFKRYFKKERLKWGNKYFIVFSIPFLIIGMMLVSVLFGKWPHITYWGNGFMVAMGLLSLLLTIGYIQEVYSIKRNIKRLNEKDYSNSEDFPYFFAKKVYYSPFFWIVSMWIVFFTGSHWIKFVMDILLAIWMVYFLSMILHPQQSFSSAKQKEMQEQMLQQIRVIVGQFVNLRVDYSADLSEESEVEEKAKSFDCPEEVRKEVLEILLKKFKDPHLLKSDVINEVSTGNKKEANLFIAQVGYYKLVNNIRLKYAEAYMEIHPKANKDKVAVEAGFNSRFGLNNVTNKNIAIDPHILEDITFDCK